jgi:putative ABC transport system permease protein
MTALLQDLRYAGRLLARSPGFTLLAAATLALGVGASATIFTIVDAVLLRPLEYRQPERLTFISSQFPKLGFDRFWVAAPEYFEFRRYNRSFADVGAYTTDAVNVTGRDQPLRVHAAYLTATLFTTLGVPAERGTFFTPRQDLPHAEAVVVLGDGLWRRAFGADPAIVGRRVSVDGTPRTVVGVMPPGFDLASQHVEVWLPLALDPADPGFRGAHYLYLIGRLRPGASLAAARGDLEGMLARWSTEIPNAHTPNTTTHRLQIVPLKEDLVGKSRPRMLLLSLMAAMMLVIACANVANLLLARAEARQKEIAVRTALGAGRGRLLGQFLTESVALAVLGGAFGLLLAFWGVRAIVAANPDSLPRVAEVHVGVRSLLFTLLAALATGVLFGLAPALHARSSAFFAVLKEGGQRSTAGAGRQLFRNVLVVLEVALAGALVITGGLLLRSFLALQKVDPGFRPQGVLSLQISLPDSLYPKPEQVTAFYARLLERLAGLPGVAAAAAMDGLPPKRDANGNDTVFESVPVDPKGPPHNVDYWQFATRDYLRVMGIPLVAGRWFNRGDALGAPGVVVINQAMARVFWPGKSPLGQRLRHPFPKMPWVTIVGIVGDVKQGGLDQKAGSELYFPVEQSPASTGGAPRSLYVVVRTAGDPLALAAPVEAELRRLDPSLAAADLRTLEQVIAAAEAAPRSNALVIGIFAVVALLLAAVGTYGVLSYRVELRTQEIGVRMALGARPADVLGMVLAQGGRLVALGLAGGILLAFAIRRWLASLLFGVTATDPATLVGVALLLALVALAACYVPARRATRVDPLLALRQE